MPEKRPAPRQSTITALIKPLIAAGCEIRGIKYHEDGSIEVLTAASAEPASAFDRWQAGRDAGSA